MVVDLIKAVPALAADLLQVGERGYRHLITDGRMVVDLIKAVPALAADLLQVGERGYRHLITDGWMVADLVEAVPMRAASLLKPEEESGFRHLVTEAVLNASEVTKLYYYQARTIKSILIPIAQVAPMLAADLLMLNVTEESRNLMAEGNCRHLVANGFVLAEIIKVAPALAASLLKSKKEGGFRHVISAKYELVSIIKAAPALAADLLMPNIEDIEENCCRLIRNGFVLADIIEVTPALARSLLKSKEEGGFRHVISTEAELYSIIKADPTLAADLLKSQEEGGCRHLIRSLEWLINIIEKVPEWAADLLKPKDRGGCLTEELSLEFLIPLLPAEALLAVLEQNIDLFPKLSGWEYRFHQSEHMIEYCYAAFHYQLNQLSKESWPQETFIELQLFLNRVKELVTSKDFEVSKLVNFIDAHREDSSSQLFMAMILSNPEDEFNELSQLPHEEWLGQVDYYERLFEAERCAREALLSKHELIRGLAKACLFYCKMNLLTYLDMYKEMIKEIKRGKIREEITKEQAQDMTEEMKEKRIKEQIEAMEKDIEKKTKKEREELKGIEVEGEGIEEEMQNLSEEDQHIREQVKEHLKGLHKLEFNVMSKESLAKPSLPVEKVFSRPLSPSFFAGQAKVRTEEAKIEEVSKVPVKRG